MAASDFLEMSHEKLSPHGSLQTCVPTPSKAIIMHSGITLSQKDNISNNSGHPSRILVIVSCELHDASICISPMRKSRSHDLDINSGNEGGDGGDAEDGKWHKNWRKKGVGKQHA